MLRSFVLLLFFTGMQLTGLAQSLTVSGYVRDAKTGETLIGATVAVKERPGTGTVTNAYGYYALSLPPGNYTLVFGYLGYASREQALRLSAATKLNAELDMAGQQLQEVVVTGESETERLRQTQMGVEKISIQTINKLPVLLGERDFLKSMQLLPGVKVPARDKAASRYAEAHSTKTSSCSTMHPFTTPRTSWVSSLPSTATPSKR